MNIIQLQILAIAMLAAIACALPGVFLVLRGVALMSDAISHAILFGIAVMFLIVQRLESPLLLLGATLAGLLTVFCTEGLIQIRSLKKDAAIGLVFPLLFSIGVILISRYARNVHLDTDMILLGEIAFAPFNRLSLYGVDLGPYALWLLSCIVFFNAVFIALFYKELVLATFDQELASVFGFMPLAMYYALMTMTSITAVAAFDVVGAIVVVSLMITPAATAYLLTDRLSVMLVLATVFGTIASTAGYWLAHVLDVSIAGSIAVMTGLFFLCGLLAAPQKGLVARALRKKREKVILGKRMLCVYLFRCSLVKKKVSCGATGSSMHHIKKVFDWQESIARGILNGAQQDGYVCMKGGLVYLTHKGYVYAQS